MLAYQEKLKKAQEDAEKSKVEEAKKAKHKQLKRKAGERFEKRLKEIMPPKDEGDQDTEVPTPSETDSPDTHAKKTQAIADQIQILRVAVSSSSRALR